MDYPVAMNVVTKIAMFTKQIITLNGAVCCLHFFGFVCSSCHCDCEPGGGGGGDVNVLCDCKVLLHFHTYVMLRYC